MADMVSLDKFIMYRASLVQTDIAPLMMRWTFTKLCSHHGFCSQDLADFISTSSKTVNIRAKPMACPVVQLLAIYHTSCVATLDFPICHLRHEAWQVLMRMRQMRHKNTYLPKTDDFPEFELTATVNDWKQILQAKKAVNKAVKQHGSKKSSMPICRHR